MGTLNKIKLEDYLTGFKVLKNPPLFPVGAIVFDERNRTPVLKFLKSKKIDVLNIDGHPDPVLKNLVEIVKKKKLISWNITGDIDPALLNQLSNLAHGRLDFAPAGVKRQIIINPLPRGGKLVLLMNRQSYQDLILQDIITSVCRV